MDINLIDRRRFIFGLGATATIVSLPVLANKSTTSAKQNVKKAISYMGPSKIPNVPLLTHEDKKIKFYDDMVKDKILVMNMMYADCSGICPATTSNLMQVNRLIAKQLPGAPIQMCSLTLKPEEDTVAHLAHYVKMHHIPSGWLFLTGQPEMVKLLRYSLGFYDPDPAIDGLDATHTGMLRIGNNRLSRWGIMPAQSKPDQLVKMIGHVARWQSV